MQIRIPNNGLFFVSYKEKRQETQGQIVSHFKQFLTWSKNKLNKKNCKQRDRLLAHPPFIIIFSEVQSKRRYSFSYHANLTCGLNDSYFGPFCTRMCTISTSFFIIKKQLKGRNCDVLHQTLCRIYRKPEVLRKETKAYEPPKGVI